MNRAKVIRADVRGYGGALQAGIRAALGPFVIMGDADGEHDFSPDQLAPFVERLKSGDDLVVGNRFRGGIRPGAMPSLHRYIGNPLLSGILNLFFRTGVGDAHCGLRAFRKDAYNSLGLTSVGMEFASEMVVKASLLRLRISEVPIVQHPNGRGRPSHLRPFRDGWRHIRLLLSLCPLWLFLLPGGFLLASGVVLMVWSTLGIAVPADPASRMASLLFGILIGAVGFQAIWLWSFAESFGRSDGLFPSADVVRRGPQPYHLETGLIAGVLLLAFGLAILSATQNPRLYQHGSPSGPGILAASRLASWGLFAMCLGAQTIFGSFFLSFLTWRNDRTNRGPNVRSPVV